MEEKAKLTELIAEAEFLQQRQLAENKAEQLSVQEKLAKAEARSQVYKEMEERMPLNPKMKVHAVATQVKKEHCKHVGILSGKVKDIRNGQKERYGCSGRSSKQEQVNTEGISQTKSSVSPDLSRMMSDLLRYQSGPEVEIETFRGDHLEYHYFILVFREVVELKIDHPHGRLVQLLKYTEGEARHTIKHCIQQTREAGYQNAKLLLERHYGDRHRILAACRKEIRGLAILEEW